MILAVVNPAAGGGRCGRRVEPVLQRLRDRGVELETAFTSRPGEATELVRAAYARGRRRFVAVGGDGTGFEVVNGLFPEAAGDRAQVGFLPLGTGNSFLRDFTETGVEHSVECIAEGRARPCDVVRVEHADGVFFSINLVCLGFPADVAAVTNRRFKRLGQFGYVMGVLACLVRLPRRAIPFRADGDAAADRERCLFVTFSNSKFTGGKMMIAPQAETADGLAEQVRVGPIGRWSLLRTFPRLFDGSYVEHPAATRRGVRAVDFELDGPVDVMVDGEVLRVHPRRLEVLPGALDVMA